MVLNTLLPILVLTIPLSIPIVVWVSIRNRCKNIVEQYSGPSSTRISDLRVWVKHFDPLKKRRLFPPSLKHNMYNFYRCDLLLNRDNILVVGKTNILGRSAVVAAIVFADEQRPEDPGITFARIQTIQISGGALEIGFRDPDYKTDMSMVIRGTDLDFTQRMEHQRKQEGHQFWKTINPLMDPN